MMLKTAFNSFIKLSMAGKLISFASICLLPFLFNKSRDERVPEFSHATSTKNRFSSPFSQQKTED